MKFKSIKHKSDWKFKIFKIGDFVIYNSWVRPHLVGVVGRIISYNYKKRDESDEDYFKIFKFMDSYMVQFNNYLEEVGSSNLELVEPISDWDSESL